MKIGILTLPIKSNYGCILQAFALQKVLNDAGHDAWIIRRQWNSEGRSFFHKFAKLFYHRVIIRKFNQFIENYLQPQTPIIDTRKKILELNEMGFDAFIVGSDQIWRMRHTYGAAFNYYLDFVTNPDIKKIAYAASFGVDYWDDPHPESSIPIVKKLLKEFNAISVREKSGCRICRELFDVDGVHVLDPTLLLKKDDYIKSFSFSQFEKRYIAVYVLDMNKQIEKMVSDISTLYHLPVRYLNSRSHSILPSVVAELFKPSVEDWLKGICNAEFVLTDSYHGTLFSIIFKRQFLTIVNKNRGLARVETILGMLGLSNRIFNKDYSILSKKIDYNEVYTKLDEERSKSMDFIKSVL